MKKILAILSGVAMLFASCTNTNEESSPVPLKFPELQEYDAVAGQSYELTFVVDHNWTVSLPAESQSYAFINYNDRPESFHSGAAGEHTISVVILETAVSYAQDLIVCVDLTMNGHTATIAKYKIARSEFPVNVTGAPTAGMEESVKSTFTQGGHPENGPFASAPHTYTLRHFKGINAQYGDFYVQHDLSPDVYNYAVYVKGGTGKFILADENSWVNFITFGDNDEKFRLEMSYNQGRITKNVGYEAYVNLEDEYGKPLVSVYHVFNPDDEIVVDTSMSLAYPDLATSKGVTMKGTGTTITLTIPSADIIARPAEQTPTIDESESTEGSESTTVKLNPTDDNLAAALKFTGYNEVYGGFGSGTDKLNFVYDSERDVYYLCLAAGAQPAEITRTEVLNISAVGDVMHSYTVNLVFDWIEEGGDITADGTVNFVNAETAEAAGATLVKLMSTDADYSKEWGVEHQYRLTYTSQELFSNPAAVALNIPGFVQGMVVNIDDMSEQHFNYSGALEFAKSESTGEVTLTLRKDKEGNNVENYIPNGSCELFCNDAEGTKLIRILFVLNAQ